MQFTKLRDGLAVGCAFNHAVLDGTSTWHFMSSWAELCRGGQPSLPLRPRAPGPAPVHRGPREDGPRARVHGRPGRDAPRRAPGAGGRAAAEGHRRARRGRGRPEAGGVRGGAQASARTGAAPPRHRRAAPLLVAHQGRAIPPLGEAHWVREAGGEATMDSPTDDSFACLLDCLDPEGLRRYAMLWILSCSLWIWDDEMWRVR
jgi:hypothetical protein